ncbi:tyrosine-type recombinase/integrase, partial [Streptomyces sp. NPDC006662]|uniref:tyrosine-type recombinase/integrase n=1 Tax=Streptomyces sp. NPDC006662 TaxID=3156902 RepID=UPI0033FEF6DD
EQLPQLIRHQPLGKTRHAQHNELNRQRKRRIRERVLYVRCTLSAIDNNHLVITSPKTRTSKNWVAISPRVATALHHQARSRAHAHNNPSDPFSGLVFCRPDGRPLRPHTVLDRLRQLSQEAGVPRVTVHDLRHLAATITITAGVPLTVVRPDWLPPHRQPTLKRACDHTATTSIPGMEKAVLPWVRERPPTCVNAGRDDRI